MRVGMSSRVVNDGEIVVQIGHLEHGFGGKQRILAKADHNPVRPHFFDVKIAMRERRFRFRRSGTIEQTCSFGSGMITSPLSRDGSPRAACQWRDSGSLAAFAPAAVSSDAVSLPAITLESTPTLNKLMKGSCWSISWRAVEVDSGHGANIYGQLFFPLNLLQKAVGAVNVLLRPQLCKIISAPFMSIGKSCPPVSVTRTAGRSSSLSVTVMPVHKGNTSDSLRKKNGYLLGRFRRTA